LHKEPYLTDVVLTDGGVYDNLGLETAWKKYQTILISNGGGKMAAEPDPKGDWVRHALRVNEIIDNQVRSLRVRQAIAAYEAKERAGTYWGIRVDLADYELPDSLPCPIEKTIILAELRTRLKRLDAVVQEQLINWGYAACDAAIRRWVDAGLAKPTGFPYPTSGIGYRAGGRRFQLGRLLPQRSAGSSSKLRTGMSKGMSPGWCWKKPYAIID
jgi:NTE family protein